MTTLIFNSVTIYFITEVINEKNMTTPRACNLSLIYTC